MILISVHHTSIHEIIQVWFSCWHLSLLHPSFWSFSSHCFYLLKGLKTIHFLISPNRHLGTSSHPLSPGPMCCLVYVYYHLSPRDSKHHFYPVLTQLCYHSLRKTTRIMTQIHNKGQVSCEVWLLFLSFSLDSSRTHFCSLSAWQHWPFSLSMNTSHLHSIPRPLQGLSLVLVNTCLA